jgi:hypothetical protein
VLVGQLLGKKQHFLRGRPANPAELFALAGRAPCVPGIGFTVKDTWLGSSMMCTIRAEAEALDEAGMLQPAYDCCGSSVAVCATV